MSPIVFVLMLALAYYVGFVDGSTGRPPPGRLQLPGGERRPRLLPP